MTMNLLNDIIKNSKNILLVSHINPDGDTLGSMSAVYSLIKDNYKKNCDMALVSRLPYTYEFLPNIEKAKYIEDIDLSREYDLVINLDVASIDRCAQAQVLFNKAKNTVNIDHHETNSNYADVNIIDSDASATGELILQLAYDLNWKVSKDCAQCLYTAILTDTGGFKFSNTTPKTLDYAGKLLALGADGCEIYKKCYESYSKNMVLFQSYCVNKAEFLYNDTIAYTIVYKKDLEKFKNDGEDFTDGLTEKLRAIKTTEIAFVIKELSPTLSKVSMRSKSKDISKVCAALGGGGHKLAAGAVIKDNTKNGLELILKEFRKQNLC